MYRKMQTRKNSAFGHFSHMLAFLPISRTFKCPCKQVHEGPLSQSDQVPMYLSTSKVPKCTTVPECLKCLT